MSYLNIRRERQSDSGLTGIFSVKTIGYDELGEIRWHAPWRRYVFYPNSGTLFDSSCLLEICSFIGNEMDKRKVK